MTYKYEYLLHVWGGFWNPWNKEIHNEPETEYLWFDTAEERQAELDRLRKIASELGTWDACIAHSMSEGYLTRYRHILHSLVMVDGQIIEVENDLGYGFFTQSDIEEDASSIQYFKDEKWDMRNDLPDNAERLFTTLIMRP